MNAQNVIECGDTVLTWTREQDREILKSCRATGANYKTFKNLAKCFPDKTDSQVCMESETMKIEIYVSNSYLKISLLY